MNRTQRYFSTQSLHGVEARKKWVKKQDYVPLAQRDWDGKVIVLPTGFSPRYV
jgi:hypothetical protein